MLDGVHLAAGKPRARLHDDGSRRRLIVPRENLTVGNDKVHARGHDGIERANGARKFALDGAKAIDVLHEGGGPERIGLVENLVADAGGQESIGGELHADFGHLVRRNEDRAAVALLLIGYVQCVELGNHRRGVACFEAGVQNRLRRLRDEPEHIAKDSGQRRSDPRQGANTRGTDSSKKLRQNAPPSRPQWPEAREQSRRLRLVARLGKHCRELGKGELNAAPEFSNDRSTLAE